MEIYELTLKQYQKQELETLNILNIGLEFWKWPKKGKWILSTPK